MAEHNELTDPELHEIKGAAAAVSGSIPVADGNGSAPFVAGNTLYAAPIYGSMYMRFNASSTSIPTEDAYVQVAGTFTTGLVNGITFSSNTLVIATDGIYEFTMPYTLTQTDATAQEYQVALGIGGTAQVAGSFPVTCAQNAYISGTTHGFASLSEGDVIYPMITNTGNDAKGCTVETLTLTLRLVRNT